MSKTTLPNGLPIYKLMCYKPTGEKCQIVKINPAILETNLESKAFGTIIQPLDVDVKVTRTLAGIDYTVILDHISPYDLIVWNEKMTPDHIFSIRTRKGKVRNIYYPQTIKV